MKQVLLLTTVVLLAGCLSAEEEAYELVEGGQFTYQALALVCPMGADCEPIEAQQTEARFTLDTPKERCLVFTNFFQSTVGPRAYELLILDSEGALVHSQVLHPLFLTISFGPLDPGAYDLEVEPLGNLPAHAQVNQDFSYTVYCR